MYYTLEKRRYFLIEVMHKISYHKIVKPFRKAHFSKKCTFFIDKYTFSQMAFQYYNN